MQLTVSGVKKEYEDGITLPKLFEFENVRNTRICNSFNQ